MRHRDKIRNLKRNAIVHPGSVPIKLIGSQVLEEVDEGFEAFAKRHWDDAEYAFLDAASEEEKLSFLWDEIFTQIFNEHLEPYAIVLSWRPHLAPGHMSGRYSIKDNAIEIFLQAEGLDSIAEGTHSIYTSWDHFFKELIKIIAHEDIHRRQTSYGKYLPSTRLDYLERPEELMAYAYDIVDDLLDDYSKAEILRDFRTGKAAANSDNLAYIKLHVSPRSYARLLHYMVAYLEN